MKNPFVRESNTTLLIAAGIGAIAVAAGAAIYYFNKGNVPEPVVLGADDHKTDYLAYKFGKKKKHRSDVGDLGEIVHHNVH